MARVEEWALPILCLLLLQYSLHPFAGWSNANLCWSSIFAGHVVYATLLHVGRFVFCSTDWYSLVS